MPIVVLMVYTEKEYEPFDSYSRFCPAMPVSVCFSDTALYTLSKTAKGAFCFSEHIKMFFSMNSVERGCDFVFSILKEKRN